MMVSQRLIAPQSWRSGSVSLACGPLAPDEWDDGTFYGLIEVHHDLVSLPRIRIDHDFSQCGWHYSHFATTTGREVYRWKANDLLQAAKFAIRHRSEQRGDYDPAFLNWIF
jgi:hypothetical protein